VSRHSRISARQSTYIGKIKSSTQGFGWFLTLHPAVSAANPATTAPKGLLLTNFLLFGYFSNMAVRFFKYFQKNLRN